MDEQTTLGPYLRRERERRGLTLRTISENTKVSVALLEGLEADDVSRWPGGIFRRAFVRSYAQCVGLDADEIVRRFEQQHHQTEPAIGSINGAAASIPVPLPTTVKPPMGETSSAPARPSSRRARFQGTAADLTVAIALAFGSAAAGSRLLWPVLLIAGYYSIGILLTGTSPMVALLSDHPLPAPTPRPSDQPQQPAVQTGRPTERRHQSRRAERARHRRGIHARAN
jgi:transcriptional regulator with XRE-family HTH domain